MNKEERKKTRKENIKKSSFNKEKIKATAFSHLKEGNIKKEKNNERKRKNKNTRNLKANISRKINYSERLNIILLIAAFLFILIIGRLIKIIVFQGEDLKKKATDQQIISKIINPSRGSILDRNGEILAQSVPVDTLSIDSKAIDKYKDKNGKKLDKEFFAVNTASILQEDVKEVREKINSGKSREVIAKQINVEKVKKYKEFLKQNDIQNIVSFEQDNKRVYPYGTLASQLIGFCGTDNTGLEGLERSYNDILSGKQGKITTIGDGNNDVIAQLPEKVIKEENGEDIYLSIDIKIQSSVEKYLKGTVEEYGADSGAVIAMNPKNGEILAMANYPTFDLNFPFAPVMMEKEKWNTLSFQEKNARLQNIWKNRAVSDPYEPGSVFKLITAATALELNVAKANTPGDFYCSGYQQVADRKISCWYKEGHGGESLHDAIKNSCNPAMIQLGRRIGQENFVKYMRAFGLFNRTGADISGESVGQFFANDNFNEVELATLSFGQRFTVNPLQVVNAVSAIVNGGQLYRPNVIHQIKNETKGTTKYIDPVLVRKVISDNHSKEIREMMRSVVETGTGKKGKVPGFSTGGKTGTSEPAPNDKNAGYVASYVGASPIEDPEIIILAVIKNPTKKSHEGSSVAAPLVSNILKDVLPGMKKTNLINLNETNIGNKEKKQVVVPNVVGKTFFEARQILQKEGIITVSKPVSNMNDVIVTAQMPKEGTNILENSYVYLVSGGESFEMVDMPDLIGNSIESAKEKLKSLGLNYIIEGNSGNVYEQNVFKDTKIEKGRVITLKIK